MRKQSRGIIIVLAALLAFVAPARATVLPSYSNAITNSAGTPLQATITVYAANTTTASTIYSDAAGLVPKANPFSTDALGRFTFYAATGLYDIKVSGTTITAYTLEDVTLGFPAMADLAAGFTLSGGVISKTLTVSGDTSTDQDVATTSSPTFAGVTIGHEGNIALTGLTTPTAPSAVVNLAAGNLTVPTEYVVTYKGTTDETAYSAVSNTVSPSSQKVDVTIPVSSDPLVTARVLYRSKISGSGNYYLVATIGNNTDVLYTDNIADGALGVNSHYLVNTNKTAGYITMDGYPLFRSTGLVLSVGKNAASGSGSGYNNVFVGDYAGRQDADGVVETFVGNQSGYSRIVLAVENTAIGGKSAYSLNEGNNNTLAGAYSGYFLVSGSYNTFIGDRAGYGASTANAPLTDTHGILIGYQANRSVVSASSLTNYIGIGSGTLIDKSNQVKIGNSSTTEMNLAGAIVLSQTPDIVSSAGAISVTTAISHIVTNGVGTVLTLAAGTEGQIKYIVLKTLTSGGQTDVITPNGGGAGFTTITMDAVGDAVTLLYTNGKWTVVGFYSCTIA